MDRKICANCKHAIPPRFWSFHGADEWMCGNPDFGHLITGKPKPCEDRRYHDELCGSQAVGFEPK